MKPQTYSPEALEAQKVVCQEEDKKPEEPKFPLEVNLEVPPTATCYLPLPVHYVEPTGTIPGMPVEKIDYSPMTKVTEVRPKADRFTLKRYSPNEWRANNQDLIDWSSRAHKFTSDNILHTKNAVLSLMDLVDKAHKNSNGALNNRLRDVSTWKMTSENSIQLMMAEVDAMEHERVRLKKSLVIIATPLSISKECLMIRSMRTDTELVRDKVEEALLKEVEMLSDVNALLHKTGDDFTYQQELNRKARERLEHHWSDKNAAFNIDKECNELNRNATLLFNPGSVKIPAGQTSEGCWHYFTEETIKECEQVRQDSIKLRATLDTTLMTVAEDIEKSGELLEKLFLSHIKCLEQTERRLMQELHQCINDLVKTEHRIARLQNIIKEQDMSMKLVQTRLSKRSFRTNLENCRDQAQQRLIDEVGALQDAIEGFERVLQEAEQSKNNLVELRVKLEHDIMLKRKSLFLDRDRCMKLRCHFPSPGALKNAV